MELKELGFQVHYCSIAKLLHEQDYSLQASRKTSEGKKDHPDRDAQFRHINNEVKLFIKDNQPVISVDTKKKELVYEADAVPKIINHSVFPISCSLRKTPLTARVQVRRIYHHITR